MNIFEKVHFYFAERAYYVGFLSDAEMNLSDEKRFKSIHWLKLGKYEEGWFADPFFLSVSESRIELLVEEWVYVQKKGRLSHLDIKRSGNEFILEKVTPILELDTHLSFPIPFIENGKVYIYPENSESGCLKIYEYDREAKRLIKPRLIICEPLLDTQIVKIENRYYAMGVVYSLGNQDDTKTLRIYESDTLIGEYHLIQVIKNDHRVERGAGLIFSKENIQIRPVQDCEGDYGLAVLLNQISFIKGRLVEKEIDRISPIREMKNGLGLHTYNYMNGVHVIDGKEFRRGVLSRFISKLL